MRRLNCKRTEHR